MPVCFCKKLMFFVQKGERFRNLFKDCVRDFLALLEFFLRQKVTIPENITFADSVSGICSKLAKNLVLELWQFSFIRDWPEILKSEIPTSNFCPISGDWGKLWTPNLARMSLIEFYWFAAKFQDYIFYRFWINKGKPTGH